MNVSPRVALYARVVNFETKAVQHCGDGHSRSLLTIYADGKCLDTAQKEEAIEGGEGIPNRVNDKRYLLQAYTSINPWDRAIENGGVP
jgi:hypothetical protein